MNPLPCPEGWESIPDKRSVTGNALVKPLGDGRRILLRVESGCFWPEIQEMRFVGVRRLDKGWGFLSFETAIEVCEREGAKR